MRISSIFAIATVGAIIALPYLTLSPPLKVGDPPPGSRPAAGPYLSGTAEAGKQAFSGSCADCHGQEGQGGTARALDRMAFSRDFMRMRDLHESATARIPGHEGLERLLDHRDDRERFNNVELMGKYLREMQRKRDRD